jgi:hypothetical protein
MLAAARQPTSFSALCGTTEEAAEKVVLRVEMYPTQAKKRLEWATLRFFAAIGVSFSTKR